MDSTNPYEPPRTPSEPAGFELSVKALLRLDRCILTLRVIVLSLVAGPTIYGIICISANSGKPQTLGTNVYLFVAGLSVPMTAMGMILPRIIPLSTRLSKSARSQFRAELEPEEAVVVAIFGGIQIRTIIGCAAFEGAAFANLAHYNIHLELVHLLIAGVLVLLVLAHFPLRGNVLAKVEAVIKRQRSVEKST